MQEPIQEIEFLARSAARVQILRELSESGELTRSDLRNHIDCSRTTVQRNLDSLIDKGIVSNSYQTYELTPRGVYLAGSFLNIVESTAVFNRLEPVLKWIDHDDLDIDLCHFSDATLVVPDDGDPYKMINHHVNVIRGSEQAFGLLPFTGLHATEAATSEVIDHGATMEIIGTPTVVDTHCSDPQYRELNDAAIDTGRWAVYEYPGALPFCLVVIDDIVQLLVAADGEPRGLLETESDAVRSWAVDTYNSYKQESTLVLGQAQPSIPS
jgi:predicted transcriptional regulator